MIYDTIIVGTGSAGYVLAAGTIVGLILPAVLRKRPKAILMAGGNNYLLNEIIIRYKNYPPAGE